MPTLEETILAFIGDMERSKTSDPDIVFTEKNGVTGTVSMGYIYSMPFRTNPEKKQLIIKRIIVNGKSVVTPTLQKISRETPLTEIKIESIQNAEWIPMLQRKGWTIETDDGMHHAVIKKGGRKSKKSKSRKRKSRRS
jgi:hypothetical protein